MTNDLQKSTISLLPLLFSFVVFSMVMVCGSCSEQKEKETGTAAEKVKEEKLFSSVPYGQSGVDFENTLVETAESNYYQYMYSYIGGGVAAADFDNDGLIDLFFTSNSNDNKLYRNKGKFQFEDITSRAGIEQRAGFDSGVSVADVNNDGWLDIYISRGGWQDEDNKFANMLYINNGDMTFTEKAAAFGLADTNRSIQATFFDYDKDNDLDVYVSNTPNITERTKVVDLNQVQKDPKSQLLKGSDRLYSNDGNGHFTDVSETAGILSDIGFGLNPQIGDLNNDGWPDIYVCNDFNVPDLVYINNQRGGFEERREEVVQHMSFNSMGSDIADIDNDGLMDLMTLDMNPEDYVRSKTTMAMTSIEQFDRMVNNGYHYQYMHNMLQLNNGNGTFSEIAQMAGMANTDWSWAILAADFDLDGFNDIFVTNGVYRDVIDRDKNSEILQLLRAKGSKPTAEDFLRYTQMLPQQKLVNYFFRNKGDLTFEDHSLQWTDSTATFSNGAAYADLDNDGDLDLIVNNINEKATLLKNNAIESGKGNFLQMTFEGPKANRFGEGVRVELHLSNGDIQTRQVVSSRGFLSSVGHKLHFGLTHQDSIESIEITWPDNKKQSIAKTAPNKHLRIRYAVAEKPEEKKEKASKNRVFEKVALNQQHQETAFNDYGLQVLLPHKLSQLGPAIAVADVNDDGYEDIYIGGAHRQTGKLLLGQPSLSFRERAITDFEKDKQREDVGACFFDADGDGDQDLYVVSGSYEFFSKPKLLQDRLYLNDGKGRFTKAMDKLPEMISAGSVVIANDYDQDGDTDLFVGGRVVPGKYPYAPNHYLLLNDKGNFTIASKQLTQGLEKLGMITDAIWTDMNDDQYVDLVVTGEWMGIEVLINEGGRLVKSDAYPTLASKIGWWNKLEIADVDNDGDKDIIAGNLGLNYKFHASEEEPFHVYTGDFDFNGVEDIMLAKYYKNKQVPVRGKVCMTQQMPHLAKKISSFNEFASKDLKGIVGPKLESALHYQATEFRSGIFLKDENQGYNFSPFVMKVQQYPINSIVYADFDGDNKKDILLAGNNYQSEVETTRADAGTGSFLKGKENGKFDYIPHQITGFFAHKDVRHLLPINHKNQTLIIVANNNSTHDLYHVKR